MVSDRPQLEVLVRGVFDRARFLDLVRNFVVYAGDGMSMVKKIAKYHQYWAVNKAVVSKSVSVLVDRALVALLEGPRGSRPMYLTRAGAEMHVHIERIVRAEQVLAQQAGGIRLVDRLLQILRRLLELAAAVDVGHARADRVAAQRRALDHLMRVVPNQLMILECTRLAFI